MPITKRKLALLVTSGLIGGLVWVSLHTLAASKAEYRLGETGICIPDEYAVLLPGARNSEKDDFDSSEGYGFNASIDSEEVSSNVEGYQETFNIGGDSRNQDLYMSLYPASENALTVDNPKPERRIKGTKDIFLSGYTPEPLLLMDALKKDGRQYEKWGYCMHISWNNSPTKLRCKRTSLNVDSIRVKYEIVEPNLHLHDEIDKFIRNKVRGWQCQ